ncbi:MAG: GGDEF domain-containing protein [Phycisphaerae bacterium]|nr:GGDEF domain-containing protein [Phycisphaerae bacterium]
MRGTILIALAALFAAGPVWWIDRSLADARSARHFANDQALLAVALAAFMESAATPDSNLDAWIAELADANERVRWAGVFRSPEDGLEFRRATSLPRDQITAQIDFAAKSPACVPLKLGHRDSARFTLLTIPRADGGMLSAIIDVGSGTTNAFAAGVAVALGVAGIGLFVVLALFQTLILRPMAVLSRRVVNIGEGLSRIGGDTPDELAGLLASAEAAQRELREWRAQATQLRTALDLHSEQETRRTEHTERLAGERDAQTGLLTGAALERELPGMLARQSATGGELTLLIIALDHFDEFAVRHGAGQGDELLAFVGGLLRSCTRRGVDLAARYGTTQFALALPETPPGRAADVAHRLAAMFGQRLRTLVAGPPVVTVCAGIASLREHQLMTPDALLIAAGQSLTRGRRHGTPVMTYECLFTPTEA